MHTIRLDHVRLDLGEFHLSASGLAFAGREGNPVGFRKAGNLNPFATGFPLRPELEQAALAASLNPKPKP